MVVQFFVVCKLLWASYTTEFAFWFIIVGQLKNLDDKLKTSAELIVLMLCHLKIQDAMSLGFKMVSAKTQLTVGGVGCLCCMSLVLG